MFRWCYCVILCHYQSCRAHALWFVITDKETRPTRIDVTALLVGLIAAGVVVVIVGLLIWYFYHNKCKGDISRAR